MRLRLTVALIAPLALGLDNAVGRTPVLGFNSCALQRAFHLQMTRARARASPAALLSGSLFRHPSRFRWNVFACKVNETLMMETMDAFVTLGLRDAGYLYVGVVSSGFEI